MKCYISCSVGELIDKITILQIKLNKIKDQESLKNINNELNNIQKDNPLSNTKDDLFDELKQVNQKLWILEDLIREKSSNKEFDTKYIEIAESIHKTNDIRFKIKKNINKKYKSELIEEKGYSQDKSEKNKKIIVNITDEDRHKLENGKMTYTKGQYTLSYKYLKPLMTKFSEYNTYNSFFVDLLFAYENITNMLNIKNVNVDKLHNVMKKLYILDLSNEQKNYCESMYAMVCLKLNQYTHESIKFINPVTGPKVNCRNMTFFKENDTNKRLLVYDGGGIGDKLMLARFIPILCNKYSYNNIIFFVNECVVWFFDNCFKHIPNYKTVSYNNPELIGHFDYHCGLLTLMHHLNIEYNNITFSPLLTNIYINNIPNEISSTICETLNSISTPKFIFNWKGNSQNTHEEHNRMMKLVDAIPLFQLSNITWIVITKDLTKHEKKILDKYKILYYGNVLDNGSNSYEDSIHIFKHVDGVFSTDTSMVHLSANLGIKTYTLLTLGCEWRWGRNSTTTIWYPDIVLLRQNKLNDWTNVIYKIKEMCDIYIT
tara:strand:- start:12238 stop:13869 length:1632 start_codon:yes stop_codon:yes gene_type:complete